MARTNTDEMRQQDTILAPSMRWSLKPSQAPTHVAAELVLIARGYTLAEARYGLQFWRTDMTLTRKNVNWIVRNACDFIKIKRDDIAIGSSAYTGVAYFWASKYKHTLRSASPKTRRDVHDTLLDENLTLHGETARHDEIVNDSCRAAGVFANYNQDEK